MSEAINFPLSTYIHLYVLGSRWKVESQAITFWWFVFFVFSLFKENRKFEQTRFRESFIKSFRAESIRERFGFECRSKLKFFPLIKFWWSVFIIEKLRWYVDLLRSWGWKNFNVFCYFIEFGLKCTFAPDNFTNFGMKILPFDQACTLVMFKVLVKSNECSIT